MSLENLVLLGYEIETGERLEGEPSYRLRVHTDINRLSGRRKRRSLEVPDEPMAALQERIRIDLRALKVPMPYAYGCLPGGQVRKEIERHQGHRYFWLGDLKGAYQSVDIARLSEIVVTSCPGLLGHEEEARRFFESYCRSQFGGLPQGAHASPDLFNLYCAAVLDVPISQICLDNGLTYTRYLDDLTISGNVTVSRRMRKLLFNIISRAGFVINYTKLHFHDLHTGRVIIHGVCLESDGRIFLPLGFLHHLSGLLFKGLKGDAGLKSRIDGTMGVFQAFRDRRHPTVKEKKILQMYAQYRFQLKLAEKGQRSR